MVDDTEDQEELKYYAPYLTEDGVDDSSSEHQLEDKSEIEIGEEPEYLPAELVDKDFGGDPRIRTMRNHSDNDIRNIGLIGSPLPAGISRSSEHNCQGQR